MEDFEFSKECKADSDLNDWFDWFVSKKIACAVVRQGEDFVLWREKTLGIVPHTPVTKLPSKVVRRYTPARIERNS